MKLMKHLMIALVLCAIPAVAVGQTVSCDDCTHSVPVYVGEGGLIASTDADAVTWVATCNSVTRNGELTPNADGVVAMLLAGDLVCQGDDEASFDLGPIEDGGWYWLTMATNSAVGPLVSMDILDNATVDIANAGAGVTVTAGKGAVLLAETATGRVGILPNILPEPPAAPATVCGPRYNSGTRAWDRQQTTGCMVGGGGTRIRLTGPGAHGGRAPITNGMVYRPTTGQVDVHADLWVDETGSYASSTTTPRTPISDVTAIQQGWLGKAPGDRNWLNARYKAYVDQDIGPAREVTGTDSFAGVSVPFTGSASDPLGQATIRIVPDSAYCGRNANHTAVVNIHADPSDTGMHPQPVTGTDAGLPASLAEIAVVAQLRVVCPPAQ